MDVTETKLNVPSVPFLKLNSVANTNILIPERKR